jgi:uncharacterized protein (TIGR02117 family)
MQILKKTLKYLAYFLLVVLLFVGIYALAVYTLPKIVVEREPATSEDVTLYILTNGMHTDLVMPVKTATIDWSREIKYENTKKADTTLAFIAMGWGDKGFYLDTPTWAELKYSTAFRAAFALSTTAIHTTFYDKMTVGERCRMFKMSNAEYARLVTYIHESLQKDANKQPIFIKTTAIYGENDAFYEANGSYSMLHTCNTWANNGLKAAGQKACYWTPFDTGIFALYPIEASHTSGQ